MINLSAVRDGGYERVNAVTDAETSWKYAVAARKIEFENLEGLVTLIYAELVLSGAPEATLSQMRTLVRLLRGTRAVAKNPDAPASDYRSVSQKNFDDVVANFARLVSMITAEANYNPIEDYLKVVALTAKLEAMRAANSAVITAYAELEAARGERNDFFDTPVTGLSDVFITAKKVMQTCYGSGSDRYKRVKGLAFRKIKR